MIGARCLIWPRRSNHSIINLLHYESLRSVSSRSLSRTRCCENSLVTSRACKPTPRWTPNFKLDFSQKLPLNDRDRAFRKAELFNDSEHVPVRPSATWLTSHPETLDTADLISQLPRLNHPEHKHLNTAIFLVTPSTAKWFEPGHQFHQNAVRHIYSEFASQTLPCSIVAVVDALPGPELYTSKSQNESIFRGYEGLALCLTSEVKDLQLRKSNDDIGLIGFSQMATVENDNVLRVSAAFPVANTLFVNGLQNTVFFHSWENKGTTSTGKWTLKSRAEIQSFNLPVRNYGTSTDMVETPLMPITAPRTIISSMGNVVRQVMDNTGKTIPASAELEEAVPKFLKSQTYQSNLTIYALITPEQSAAPGKEVSNETVDLDAGRVGSSEHSVFNSALASAFSAGGRLHRVTSGGGGWGKKKGLLSLEPATSFITKPESDGTFDFDLDHDLPKLGGSKDLAPPGSSIQFFTSYPAPIEPVNADLLAKAHQDVSKYTIDNWMQQPEVFRFGTLENTDEVHEEALVKSPASARKDLICMPHKLGMLSRSGSCVNVGTVHSSDDGKRVNMKPKHSTRIDVPYTVYLKR